MDETSSLSEPNVSSHDVDSEDKSSMPPLIVRHKMDVDDDMSSSEGSEVEADLFTYIDDDDSIDSMPPLMSRKNYVEDNDDDSEDGSEGSSIPPFISRHVVDTKICPRYMRVWITWSTRTLMT